MKLSSDADINVPKPHQLYCSNDSIYICLASDSNYEPHLWVTISSIIKSAKSKSEYYIYILDGGIKDRGAFFTLVDTDKRFNIEFIDMTGRFISAFESRHLSRAAYYRLAVFELFKNFERIIYLDADSYVLSDISELMNLNMGRKQIAGAKDSITYEIPWREKHISYKEFTGKAIEYYKKLLSSKKPLEEYFSSGVLVFNLKNTNLIEKRRELDKLLPNNYFSHDQDILNLLFSEDETYELPRAWNYFNSAPTLQFKDFIDRKERENYLEGKVKPKIVSYVLKPWLKENFNAPFAEEYWDELRNSPYYEKVKRSSLKNGKIARFLKLNLKEKVVFLTSRELLIKIFKRINN